MSKQGCFLQPTFPSYWTFFPFIIYLLSVCKAIASYLGLSFAHSYIHGAQHGVWHRGGYLNTSHTNPIRGVILTTHSQKALLQPNPPQETKGGGKEGRAVPWTVNANPKSRIVKLKTLYNHQPPGPVTHSSPGRSWFLLHDPLCSPIQDQLSLTECFLYTLQGPGCSMTWKNFLSSLILEAALGGMNPILQVRNPILPNILPSK